MEANPCSDCTRRNHDKNNPVCRDCDKRVDYVKRLELKLNFIASCGDSQPLAHQVSYLLRSRSYLSPEGDPIY